MTIFVLNLSVLNIKKELKFNAHVDLRFGERIAVDRKESGVFCKESLPNSVPH